MARRIGEAQRAAAALQACRRMVSRGDRPLFRLQAAQDGSWAVDGCPWLVVPATGRRGAPSAARAVIAAWLDVPPDAFDVETQ